MGMDDDWDLQAVVRGCCSASPPSTSMAATTTTSNTDPFSFLSPFLLDEDEDDDHLLDFPDLLATQTAIKELEELCMPFFPKSNLSQPISSPTSTTISTPSTAAHPQPLPPRPSQSQISRSTKRRKNQQKRVVCQVPAEGISSDMWAWRKYGQKPIKGSPYPRGYYRCSSSKGCLARKQVERCRNDPNMFVITYTSEHNHPLPTHRNSLAGSTRQKYTDTNAAPHHHPATPPQSDGKDNTALTAAGLSPTTPLTASMEEEDEEMLLHPCKQENDHREEEEEEEKMFLDEFLGGPNQITTEDCFLEELSFSLPTPWFSHNAATAAGGR